MKRSELYKYPKNILIPVVFLILGMVVVYTVYKLNSINVIKPTVVQPSLKMPINTRANFLVEAPVKLELPSNKSLDINFSGKSVMDIDISSGEVVLESLDLSSQKNNIPINDYNLSTIKIKLNSKYPSTGKVDISEGKIDLSVDLLADFSFKTLNREYTPTEINISVPLTGDIDKEAGIIRLSGEATIPPGKFPLPLPINIQVVATTNPVSTEDVSKSKSD